MKDWKTWAIILLAGVALFQYQELRNFKRTRTPNKVSVVYDETHDPVAIRNKAFFDAQAARIKAEQDCNAKLLESQQKR